MDNYYIDPDIKKAETLPSSFYQSETVFQVLKERVFSRSWQWIGDKDTLFIGANNVNPIVLLDSFLSEQLVLVKEDVNELKCLSNVCTHRGNLVVKNTGVLRHLVCSYHGRQFHTDGRFKFMPEFAEVLDFPRACDHLKPIALKQWASHLFVNLNPKFDFSEIVRVLNERTSFLPLQNMYLDANRSKTYQIDAHWALYCDNYLEGFHIPFVHKDLNEALDYGRYQTLVFDHISLQIGYASADDVVFNLPESHPDYGEQVAAYYFWLFPNMMLNFYPWGLSINIVKPLGLEKTEISFHSYVYEESKLGKGAGADLDKVEYEDEEVVESVQKGLKSRFYKTGRFSPTMEKGVHHFHLLLARYLNEGSKRLQ